MVEALEASKESSAPGLPDVQARGEVYVTVVVGNQKLIYDVPTAQLLRLRLHEALTAIDNAFPANKPPKVRAKTKAKARKRAARKPK